MVYDCFPFFNELEILDIRLHELNDVVDKFVLVESTVTHTNQPKRLYYQENKHLFKKFHKKIIHIVVTDTPDVGMTWIVERFQHTAILRGLTKCKPNDVILFSCVDEIPRAGKILEWKDKPGRLKSFQQISCYYYLNYVNRKVPTVRSTRMFRYKDIRKFKDVYYALFLKPDVEIPDGGWHFSYIGDIKTIQKKIASFAHQEFNNDKYNTPERIRRAISEGKDPFDLGWKFHIADEKFLPEYVLENKEKFKDLLAKKPDGNRFFYKLAVIPFLELRRLARINILRKLRRNYYFKKLMLNEI